MSWPVDGVYASLNEVRVEFLCGGRAPKGNRMVGIGNEGWKRIQQLILPRGTILNQISTVDRRGLTFSSNRFVSPVCPAYCFNILPVVKRTMAFRQEYSAESTCSALSFSTCSWKMRMWSIKATTRSAAIGLAWSPAAANSGATCNGIEHCDAFRTNSSLHTKRKRATWSVTCPFHPISQGLLI